MTIKVYCNRPSRTARTLARALQGRKIDATATGRRVPTIADTVINYGSTHYPAWPRGIRMFNRPEAVSLASSKLVTTQLLTAYNIPCVENTGDLDIALEWEAQGHPVLSRRDGLSQGRGINAGVVPGDVVFYSKVFKKTHEFRVHVGLSLLDATRRMAVVYQKKRLQGVEADGLVRSHANGWVFSKNNLVVGEEDLEILRALACAAVGALELDFGAVDILVKMSSKDKAPRRIRGGARRAVVCEVNTAPGITIDDLYTEYVNYFRGEM